MNRRGFLRGIISGAAILPAAPVVFDMGRRAAMPSFFGLDRSLDSTRLGNIVLANPSDIVVLDPDAVRIEMDPYCPKGHVYITSIDRHSGQVSMQSEFDPSWRESDYMHAILGDPK